jgi:hypothetical protein
MVDTKRQIVIHSDYAAGDTEGPHRDARVGDILVSPDKVRVYDGALADGYLELSHDGVQAKIESSLGVVSVDGVVVVAHERRHLADGEDPIYVRAVRAPTVNDDGYGVGKRWLADGYEYVCTQDSHGDAIWRASGITANEHRTLRHLIHFMSEGPGEGFASGAYKTTTGTVFPTSIVWWESSAMLKRIADRTCTWSGVNLVTDRWRIYDTDGTTVLATVTDTIAYSGVFETTRTRVIT